MEKDERKYGELLAFIRRLPTIQPLDIPEIDLYMDQVTTFMDSRLGAYKRTPEDKILTKAMINNYTKNKVLPVPHKKKYAPEQLKLLIALYHMKGVLSLDDIGALLTHSGALNPPAREAPANGAPNQAGGFYETFAALQEAAMAHVGEVVEESLSKAREAGLPGGEEPALTLLALSLILSAGACKRVAEKIIDAYLAGV